VGTGVVVTSVLVLHNIGWNHLVSGLLSARAGAKAVRSDPFNPFDRSSFGWGYVLWQCIFLFAAVTTWQPMVSRVLSTRDSTVAKRMYRRTAFYYVGRFLIPGLWGAAAFVHFHDRGGLPAGLDSGTAMPRYLSTLLPVGLMGLVVAAMIAAEMSSVSGYLLTWETVIYNDLVTPCLKRPLSPKKQLGLMRAILVALAVFLLVYGLWYKMPGNTWDYLAVTGNIYMASVFTLLVGALYFPWTNSNGACAALVLGAVGPLAFLIVNAVWAKSHPIAPEIAGTASFALAFAGMIAGSLLVPAKAKP
jgi:SSS family solute:Na+ symporter